MRFYTPSHNEVLDTLIMYGIVEALSYADVKIRVIPTRHTYVIEVEESLDKNTMLDCTASALNDVKRYVDDALTYIEFNERWFGDAKFNEDAPKLLRIISAMGNAKNVKDAIVNLNKAIEEVSKNTIQLLQGYSVSDHTIRFKEGRASARRGMFRTPIVFNPFAGSYTQSGDFALSQKPYIVCASCLILAALGAVRYADIVYTSQTSAHMVLIRPLSEVSATKLQHVKNITSLDYMQTLLRRDCNVADLPSRLIPLYLAFFGETPAALKGVSFSVDVISYSLGRVSAIRRYSIARFERLLTRAGEIKARDLTILESIKKLSGYSPKKSVAIDALEYLLEYLETGNLMYYYMFIRSAIKEKVSVNTVVIVE